MSSKDRKWGEAKKKREAKRRRRTREVEGLAAKLAGRQSFSDLAPVTQSDVAALSHLAAILLEE